MIYSGRWSAIRRGRGDLPPIVEGLQFFGDLSSSRTSIVSGAVATLGDASGWNRDATQATSGARPTYNASDSRFGGRPSMTGDGVDDVLITASATFAAGTDLTAFFVGVAESAVASGGRPWSLGLVSHYRYGTTTTLESYFTNTSSTAKRTTVSATIPSVVATVYDASAPSASIPKVYLNGADTGVAYFATLATVAGLGMPATLRILSAGGSAFCNATAADLLLYGGALSATQVATISDWLKWRNGL